MASDQIPITLPSSVDGISPRSVTPTAPPDKVHALSSEYMMKPSLECLEEIKTLVTNTSAKDIRTIRTQLTYPLAHHIRLPDMRGNHELQRKILETMRAVVAKTRIDDTKEYIFYLRSLLAVLYDLDPDTRKLTAAILPEELIEDTMKTISLITLMLRDDTRVEVYSSHNAHFIANTIYAASQIIINEKCRSLKSAALTTMASLTGTHDRFLDDELHPKNSLVATSIADTLARILPGILVALTDVALSKENQGHLITAKAVSSIHRVICLVMNDKNMEQQDDITNADFAQVLLANRTKTPLTRYFTKSTAQTQKEPKDTNLTAQFYEMAGNKLKLVTKNLVSLLTHESDKVRKELALFCCRVIVECARSMKPSIPDIVDSLIGLSEDENEEIAKMCSKTIEVHLKDSFRDSTEDITAILADNFHAVVSTLPSVMNNIDSRKKQYNLVLLRAYITLLDNSHVLRCSNTITALCNSLIHAARIDSSNMSLLMELSIGGVESSVPVSQCQQVTPWCKMAHLDNKACEDNLKKLCYCLSAAECVESVVDVFLEMLQQGTDRAEIVYLLTHIATAQSNVNTGRILDAFIEPEMWYLPLEVASSEQPITEQDTLDVTVYNPRSWEKDSVPGLYEGAVETRYTDISLKKSREPIQIRDVTKCRTLREAKDNMLLCCLLTDGVGVIAKKLEQNFQPYMLRTLCMLLERVGSRYEMLSKAGMKALRDVTIGCGHSDVTQLIRSNADYFTYQVTKRLKKEWNCVSALHILTVVLEHSEATIMDCMQGIITDVLLQSCDRYHQNEVTSYLQVFITFVKRIRTWFPRDTNNDATPSPSKDTNEDWNVMSDTIDYIRNVIESERFLEKSEFENEMGMTVEEMYQEDLKNKQEDDGMDYSDDKEKVELPQHIAIVTKILSRCVHLLPSSRREEKTLALQVLEQGLPVLEMYQDELLPLCHHIWGPLVPRFSETKQPIVLMRALQLLVVMARVAKDFIRDRTLKEVLPKLCEFLSKSSKESLLKDVGSVYRLSHAYRLQQAALDNLATLTVELGLEDRHLEEVMSAASPYLSNKQPKPLQSLAVVYFKKMIEYDPGATCYHLRQLCDNQVVREPPTLPCKKLTLEAVVGTPDNPTDTSYKKNIDLLFGDVM